MKFPINFKKDTWLHNSGCDFCGTPMPTGEFVSFHFGGQQDYAKDGTLDLSNVEIGMGLDWQGSDPKIGTGLQVVKGTVHCQCVFNFCSTACLRKFMNRMVDELERLMEKNQSQQSGSPSTERSAGADVAADHRAVK